MATTPTSQEDWTVHALNIHGVFFERRCAAAISSTADWTLVSCNYPVEYPAPNGPWRGKESSLDLRARRLFSDGHVVDVQIECKKANPDFVNWIFFPKTFHAGQPPFWTSASINTPSEVEGGRWSTGHLVQNGKTDMPVANDSREVRGDYVKHQNNSKTKTSNAAIQDAAYQVALANRAIVGEDSTLLAAARGAASHPNPPWLKKTYIPVIVTTARLFQAEFSAMSVDIASGEVPLNAVTLISDEPGKVIPKHAWSSGMVRIEGNKSHGITPTKPLPFHSLLDMGAVIEKVLLEHDIVLHPSRKMKKYVKGKQ